MKNEILSSLTDIMHKRLSTPIYGTFLISWLIFHWRFIYTAFFVSEEYIYLVTGLLRNEYLVSSFFNLSDWYFWVSWISPFVFTWLAVWILPKLILLPAFKEEEEYRVNKIKARLSFEKEVVSEETELTHKKTQKLEAEEKQITKRKIIEKEDPESVWKEEFSYFKNSSLYKQFSYIVESLYSHGGRIVISGYGPGGSPYDSFKIPKEILAFCHSNGLVIIDNAKNKIDLTEKGKFFVAKYTNETDDF